MVDLSGNWELFDETGEYRLAIELPGDVHSALLAAKVIPDPFIGEMEKEIQWVARRGWTVRRDFFLSESDRTASMRALLEIDLLDTVAEIFVNDLLVARSSNMFVPLRIDIEHALQSGANTIEVRFDSPEREAATRAARLPYPVPHQIYPLQSMHRNLLRKAQCHASWDWGIALMAIGASGSIQLREVGTEALVAVWGVPRLAKNVSWLLPVNIEWDRFEEGGGVVPSGAPESDFAVELLASNGSVVASSNESEKSVSVVAPGRITVPLTIDRPELWWPVGYGDQPLYTVVVRFGGEERRFRTAFRTVEVVNDEDEIGRSMLFRVNGRDLWAKGANWIPVDAFPSRQTPERYRELLLDARDANMNMIRVWGGGRYEAEAFYDLCDELGILVWQDFMFSCSLYPSEDWFLEEVREEVRAQLRRLVSHPSIAIWCGNNENIGALGWFEESRVNPGRYLIDFDRLNHGVIAAEVTAFDDTRIFWPSSPAAGEGDFSDNWHDDGAGDMHYWSVWHEGKPFSAYYEVTPRFCSEFGFQSFPSLPTLRGVISKESLNPTSPQMEHHQRSPRGNAVILETIARYFRVPFTFEDFVYLSQVQQATAITTAVDYWRSRRPVSMGALYWQLNDLWPVVSWSSIEYGGRWKLLHYAARRFFAPRRLALIVKEGSVALFLFNDTAAPITGEVTIRVIGWCGEEIASEALLVRTVADASTELWRTPLADLPIAPTEGFLVAEFTDDALRADPSLEPIARAWALLAEFKEVPLVRPQLLVETIDSDADTMHTATAGKVRVRCEEAPAFHLAIEPADTRLQPTDNDFLMLPGESRTIELRPIRGHAGRATDSIDGDSTRTTIRTIRSTYG